MKGLELLKSQPTKVKRQINTKYESIEIFYKFVYNLYKLNDQLSSSKSNPDMIKKQKIQNKIVELESELLDFGAPEKNHILLEISNDWLEDKEL